MLFPARRHQEMKDERGFLEGNRAQSEVMVKKRSVCRLKTWFMLEGAHAERKFLKGILTVWLIHFIDSAEC